MSKTKTYIGVDLKTLILNIIISLLLILLWAPLAYLIISFAIIYALYRFIVLAVGGFSCAHCYAKFLLALALVIFSFGATSGGSVLIPIVLLWLNSFVKGVHK